MYYNVFVSKNVYSSWQELTFSQLWTQVCWRQWLPTQHQTISICVGKYCLEKLERFILSHLQCLENLWEISSSIEILFITYAHVCGESHSIYLKCAYESIIYIFISTNWEYIYVWIHMHMLLISCITLTWVMMLIGLNYRLS